MTVDTPIPEETEKKRVFYGPERPGSYQPSPSSSSKRDEGSSDSPTPESSDNSDNEPQECGRRKFRRNASGKKNCNSGCCE